MTSLMKTSIATYWHNNDNLMKVSLKIQLYLKRSVKASYIRDSPVKYWLEDLN